jgi:uncharacterized cupin superfamily protein
LDERATIMKRYIVTKKEIENLEGKNKTHFLNPNAKRINKSLGDMTGITGFGFHIIEIQPGFESTEMHMHFHEDECIYILNGEADALIGEKTFKVRAGDFIGYAAGGSAHKLINTSKSILRCIVVGQRLDHDIADYPQKNKRLFRQKNIEWNLVDKEDISDPRSEK